MEVTMPNEVEYAIREAKRKIHGPEGGEDLVDWLHIMAYEYRFNRDEKPCFDLAKVIVSWVLNDVADALESEE